MQYFDFKKSFRKNFNIHSLRKTLRLYKYVKPYWPEFSLGMLFLFISSLAGLAFPKLLGDLVDSSAQGHLMENINRLGLLLAGVLVGQAVFSYFRIVLFVNVTEKTLSSLRHHIYTHLIRLPMKFFLNRRVGELGSRISSDISLLQETFTTTIAEFIRQIIVIVGGVALLLHTSAKLTVFMLAIFPVIMLIAYFFGRFIRRFSKPLQTQVAEANAIVQETLQGILNVQASANEFFEMKRYREKTLEAAATGMKSGKYRGAFSSCLIMSIFGAMVAVI